MNKSLYALVLSSLMIALGVVLPYLTASNPQLGSVFLLMHIPALFAGLILGPKYGFLVGVVTPLLRSLIAGMPPLFPQALVMSFEIAGYGFFAGLIKQLLPKKDLSVLIALVAAMILGRAVYGLAAWIFYPLAGLNFTLKIFLTAAFVTGLPGITIQLVLIPLLYFGLKRTQALDGLENV
ncbi:ECF transporter S component [Acholeplasma vituli]|uniref:ECF transporter S component n=1 Tax=Paracholeplasma vituli TaxID=69473 RepID=A0ABT2PW41_9MOLU|nr:ECF transporter S component [Paracholeplasma vituli]MCU0105147.1 ECF transporter S component [Paracholeplasma vituli]